MPNGWIAALQEWLKDNQARLGQEHTRIEIVGTTSHVPSSIHVDFFAERHEATVQLWEDGQCDFHFLDWEASERDPEVGVVVTHHEFRTIGEMKGELDDLVQCLSPRMFAGVTS